LLKPFEPEEMEALVDAVCNQVRAVA
jgi:hypothetical protein